MVHNIESREAPCGSSIEVEGSWYEIRNNYVANNGLPREGSSDPEPWADGITLISCDNGYVHDNTLVDNTDIDIVVGGGPNCRIQNNTISHINVYGFAGIHIGSFNQNGNHWNSDYSGNTVTSELDKLGFGIIAGFHPWDPAVPVPDAGSTAHNSSTGAVVNLAIDGIDAGSVQSNSWSGAGGTRGFNCDIAADYTAGHFGASSIQNGYACRIYHTPYCESTCG